MGPRQPLRCRRRRRHRQYAKPLPEWAASPWLDAADVADEDDDEKYEPSEIAKLAMMDEDEYAKHIAEYMKRYRESNNK